MNRTTAIVEAALAARSLGMSIDDSIDHACRKIPASPAALVLARRIAAAAMMRREVTRG